MLERKHKKLRKYIIPSTFYVFSCRFYRIWCYMRIDIECELTSRLSLQVCALIAVREALVRYFPQSRYSDHLEWLEHRL